MKSKQSTVRDVAARAGVSITTVSRILNGGRSFSAETIRGVEQAVRELGYRRSSGSIVRAPLGAPTVTIVVSDVDLLDPFFWELLRGIYDTTEANPCTVGLRVFRGPLDDGRGLAEDAARSGAAGVVFVPSIATGAGALADAGPALPVVFLERTIPGRTESSVLADNRGGAAQVVRYLAKLGHHTVAYVGGPASLSAERDKREGFVQALAEEGLACPAHDMVEGGFERSSAKDALAARLAAPRDFSAVFVASDLLAFGVKEALDQAGLAVPRDLSLVGFGNIPFSAALGLSSVGVPAYEMGRNALLLLLDRIAGRSPEPRHVLLPTGLVLRSTCGRRES